MHLTRCTNWCLPSRSLLGKAGRAAVLAAATLALHAPLSALAQPQIEAPYSTYYSLVDLGEVPNLPTSYGGLNFKAGDPNTIIIGGNANYDDAFLYAIHVVRGTNRHITGFSGIATVVTQAPFNDGGVTYAPNGTLFLARWPQNAIGQLKPGSFVADKVTLLDQFEVTASPGGLTFVPAGYPNENQLKLAGYSDGKFYTVALTPDAQGTYSVTGVTFETQIDGGPEGFIYPPPGSPLFIDFDTMLVSEYRTGTIAAYRLTANSAPRPETRSVFVSGLTGAEGAVIDPVTGDFLFSTFGGGNHVIAVRGFNTPPTVAITSPANNATVTACTWFPLTATASDYDGTVKTVELLLGTNVLAKADSTSCSTLWKTNAVGTFALTARATDNGGAQTISSPITVNVVAPPLNYLVASGLNATGAFCLCSSGELGKTYQVLATTNLKTWTGLGPMVFTNGILEFYDRGAATNRYRFYRSSYQ